MASTSAERQRAYRQRHFKGEGTKDRINVVVSVATKARLERLARHGGVTQVAYLERMLEVADTLTVNRLVSYSHGTARLKEYYDGVTE